MKITLSTLSTNLCFHVFNDVKSSLKPVLTLHVLFSGFAATEFTLHLSTYNAYTLIMSIFNADLLSALRQGKRRANQSIFGRIVASNRLTSDFPPMAGG